MTTSDIHRAIDAVWRIESAKLIAGLARIVRDVGLAEDLAQGALMIALEPKHMFPSRFHAGPSVPRVCRRCSR